MEFHYLQYLVLAILGAPVAFGVITALAGRGGPKVARRTALWLSVVQLVLCLTLALFLGHTLSDRKDSNLHTVEPKFVPIGVPGDETSEGRSTWNLFTFSSSPLTEVPSAVQFFIGVDGLNVWLIALTSFMGLLAVLVSWESILERAGAFYGWLFALQSAIIGAFLSFDVLLFYVFFELTLIPSFFLIGHWGIGSGKRDAARKFFLYTLFGSLLTLTGIVGVVLTNRTPMVQFTVATEAKPNEPPVTKYRLPNSTDFQDRNSPTGQQIATTVETGPISFSIPRLMKNVQFWSEFHNFKVQQQKDQLKAATGNPAVKEKLTEAHDKVVEEKNSHRFTQAVLFFLLIAGFAVKVPLVPFHTWLPSAYGEAPPGVVMNFSALMAKLGTLGMLRIVIPLSPDAAVAYGLPVLGIMGAIGIVYAAFCAYGQKDIKLLAAYSSVSHLGLLVLGLFALNREGLMGASLHMLNHGLTAGAMFALVGFLADRYRTTDSNHYSGLLAKFPGFAFFFILISLASVGLPGFNNFVSEMILIGSLFTPWNATITGYGLAGVAGTGIFFSAWYTFTMIRKVFFGPLQLPTNLGHKEPKDISVREAATFGLPVILCLGLGLFPQPILDSMKADVDVVATQLDNARTRANESLAQQELSPKPSPTAAPLPAGPTPQGGMPKEGMPKGQTKGKDNDSQPKKE